MKRTITFLLIGSLSLGAVQKPKEQPKVVTQIVCGLVVLGVGLVVVWQIRKTCKRIFDQQDNPQTNAPPADALSFTGQGTNTAIVLMGKGTVLSDYGSTYQDDSVYGWIDAKSGLPINGSETCVIESSTNFQQWSEEYTVNSWASDAGVIMLYSHAGMPVLTNYLATGATNFVPLSLGPIQPKKFFRIR
jgi:multisubunit Na+/H+ antiporter MnhC subunit